MKTINVGEDFYPRPWGRYPEDGEGNGTAFREQFLVPVLKNKEKAVIVLDSVVGYSAGFLEEAFGGLVSIDGYDSNLVLDTFKLQASSSGYGVYKGAIVRFVKQAKPICNKAKVG